MIEAYLTWWSGGLCLTAVSLGFWVLERRTLGISGAVERVVFWRADRAARDAEVAMAQGALEFQAAMLAATMAEFGGDCSEEASVPEDRRAQERAPLPPLASGIRPPTSAHLAFMAFMAVGGFLGALLKGDLALRTTLGTSFDNLVGVGAPAWAVLFLGGTMVGFGTRMAGGCTSGHGLVGCARLQPGSLLATVVFFGTGIGVSLLLGSLR